ncbi:hypothetical protein MICRO8M_70058 [Microbacterium sp. 8M]|nr:hypothetical protein MICRO8M_70058 [Microbacterium sp. 8M]
MALVREPASRRRPRMDPPRRTQLRRPAGAPRAVRLTDPFSLPRSRVLSHTAGSGLPPVRPRPGLRSRRGRTAAPGERDACTPRTPPTPPAPRLLRLPPLTRR